MSCVMSVLWQYSIKLKLIVLGCVEKNRFDMFNEFSYKKRYKISAVYSPSMRCQVGKKHLFFYIYGYYILSDGCHTSTIFCGMLSFSVIFRIRSVMLSICCVMGIICYVIVIIHSVIFTISSAVHWISCLWFIIQPIPTVILELFFHQLDSLCPSCN